MANDNPLLNDASYWQDEPIQQKTGNPLLDDSSYWSEEPEHKKENDSWAFTKGVKAGADQLQALGGGAVALTGDLVGSDKMKDWGMDVYQRNMEEAGENALDYGFTDIDSIGKAAEWAGWTLGNVLPTIGASMAGGGVGGIAVKQLSKKAIAEMLKSEIAKGTSKKAAEKIVGQQIAKRVAMGQAAGAGATSIGMESGSIYGDTGDAGVSLAHGTVAGMVDALPVTRLLNKLGIGKEVTDGIKQSVIKEGLKQGVFEGGTEALQTFIEQHAKHWVESNGESLLSNVGEANFKEIADAAAAGFLGGKVLGSGAQYLGNRGLPESAANEDVAEDNSIQIDPALNAELKQLPPPPVYVQPVDENQIAGNANTGLDQPAPWRSRVEPDAIEKEVFRGVEEELFDLESEIKALENIVDNDARLKRQNEIELAWDQHIEQLNKQFDVDPVDEAVDKTKTTLPYLAKKLSGKRDSLQAELLNKNEPVNPAMANAMTPVIDGLNEQRDLASLDAEPNEQADGLPTSQRIPEVEAQGLSKRYAFEDYRAAAKGLVDQLVPGGGVSYLRDENDRITGRTSSLNPDWFQGNDDMASVKYVQETVQKALAGEKLGAKQRRIMEDLADHFDEQQQDFGEYGFFDPADDKSWYDERGVFRYRPESGAEPKTFAELEQEAREAGVSDESIRTLVAKNLPLTEHAEALYDIVQQQRTAAARHRRRSEAGAQRPDEKQTGNPRNTGTQQQGPEQQEANGPVAQNDQRSEPEGLALESYSEADLQTVEAEKALAPAKEQKAQVDREREHFALTGEGNTSMSAANKTAATPDLFSVPSKAEIDKQAHEAATSPLNDRPEPTDAQKEAGNYKKGRINVHGIDIAIENPKGSKRSGTDPDGNRWENTIHHHYGDVSGTRGADGDPIDVFVGEDLESDKVFVIDQVNKDGTFDEHKVMLGFGNKLKAIAGYKKNYDKGWRVGPVTTMSVDEFKAWTKEGDTTKPLDKALDMAADAGKEVIKEAVEGAEADDGRKTKTKQSSSYGKDNKLVSQDRAAELREKLKAKLGQLNSGIDPELLSIGTELAVFHIEAGARKFTALAKAMADDLGVELARIRPYLRSWYNGARDMMEDSGQPVSDMDGPDAVRESLNRIDQENADDLRPARNQKPDSTNRTDAIGGAENNLSDEGSGRVRRGTETVGTKASQAEGQSGAAMDDSRANADRKRSNKPVSVKESGLVPDAPRDSDSTRSDSSGTGRLFAEREANERASRSAHKATVKAQSRIQSIDGPVQLANSQQIAKQMPFLDRGQVEDIVFVERRLSKPKGFGVLLTNGTGTGKTFSGLGTIRRSVDSGKKNILIVTPSKSINDAWMKAGHTFFGIDVNELPDTKSAGKDVVVTTFANFGANPALFTRDWDLLVIDEAHKLSQNEAGDTTDALEAFRGLAMKPGSEYTRSHALNPELYSRIKTLNDAISLNNKSDDERNWYRNTELQKELDGLYEKADAAVKKQRDLIRETSDEDAPRALMLSATPFSYEKNVQLGQGFLFDWGSDKDGGAYNSGSNYEQFMIQHFGYRMRYNKLTQPDANVDRGLMQRNFNSWLKKEGVLRGRTLETDYDYDRRFILTENALGRRVDAAIEWLREHGGGEDSEGLVVDLYEKIIKDRFDYHSRMYFLEAIKAREAIPIIRKHLELGRKVLIMHGFKKGGTTNPFRLSRTELTDQETLIYDRFAAEFDDLIKDFSALPSAINSLSEAFPDLLVYNGDVSAKDRLKQQAQFNNDKDNAPMLAQGAAMREGVSIHDTTGKRQRVLLHLGMPGEPAATIQQEGRIYRVGQASDAIFRYLTIDTSWERYAFASRIAQRAGTAENLAMGEDARGLKEAFLEAYEEASDYPPGFDGEGTGGKSADRAKAKLLTDWDRAKSYYYGTVKQGNGRNARGREHSEYFATPEPLGLKMVEWADIRGGESVLEPSAGHGAIARWFPENTENRAIEYTDELSSKLSLRFNGDVQTGDFMAHHIVNKYDAIVMNPPFGHGGKQAAEHVGKAMKHLRDGGRIVALIPRGPAADKQFDALLQSDEAKHIYQIADIHLPSVTFERAGTSVATRVIVLEKQTNSEVATQLPSITRDYTQADDINAFFDRIESSDIAGRLKPAETESETVAPVKVGNIETWEAEHTKTGDKLYMAKVAKSLDRDEYKRVANIAKKHDGYWSRFGKAGFLFKNEEDREAFTSEINDSETPVAAFSRKASAGDIPNGLPVKQVELIVKGFLKKYKGADDVKLTVHKTAATIPGVDPDRDAGVVIEGRYIHSANELHINAGAFDRSGRDRASTSQVRAAIESALQEEIIVHKGLGFFSPEDRQQLYEDIQAAVANDTKLARLWDQTVNDYRPIAKSAKLNDEQSNRLYAEEMLGSLAQEKINWLAKGWNRLFLAIKRLLVKAGWVEKGIGAAELKSRIYLIASAFERGNRAVIRDFNNDIRQVEKNIVSDIPSFSRRESGNADSNSDIDALEKLGLSPKKSKGIARAIADLKNKDWKAATDWLKSRSYEGLFDGLSGLDNAEKAVGKGIAAGDYEGSGYVGARLATGIADTMHAILHYGAPEWAGGVLQHRAGTKGLLEVLGDLKGNELTDWLAWMGANRGQELMSQGRENNLTVDDIEALKSRAEGKEGKFERVRQEYLKINKAMLDLAQEAGLLDAQSRSEWQSDWYVPFYRQGDDELSLLGPRTKRGLSHQSAGIRALKGGDTATGDLLENIISNWLKLADSSVKNSALVKAMDNLSESDFISDESMRWQKVVVPRAELVKQIKGDRKYLEYWAEAMGLDVEANALEVAHELNKLDAKGYESLWRQVAPTDPDIIRVMRNGKAHFYRIHDQSVLRAVTHLGNSGFNDPVTKTARWFKRLLTTGVTASPDFILRNFVRDAAHAWAINPDGFKFGVDSAKGMSSAFKEDEAYRELMFAGASFQGGYVHGTDPEASAQLIRRALLKHGYSERQISNHLDSVVDTPEKLWSALEKGWQKYREVGDKVENANRTATFKAAKNAGKSMAQAVFEAKDLMDYSMRGNLQAMVWLTDVIPFLNARLQGLSKLGRSAKEHPKQVAVALAKISMFSVALAMLNDDDEEYKALPDWQKDAYWHFFIGGHHFSIPKPFEIGIIAGTLPERAYHTWVADTQPDEKLLWSLKHGVLETLGINPIPQMALPAIEVWGNRSFYFDTPIEGMSDEGKLPEARYSTYTSETMVQLGKALGMSPKKLEHLWEGYTGTMGAYALGLADIATRKAIDTPDQPSWRASDLPVIKSFYKGDDPARSTQYVTDLYDRLSEANELYRTMRAYKAEGLIDEAREIQAEGKDKMRYRSMLNKASKELSGLRKERDKIMRNRLLKPEAKRNRINSINEKITRIAERASARTEGTF